MAGQELLGGFIGILDGFSADLQYYAQTFGIDHYGNNSMCHLCAASKVDPAKWFTQTGAGAGWQGTQVTNAAWHAALDAQGGKCELAKIPGVHLHRLFICDLHTVNLGTAAHFAGNVIWELLTKDKIWQVERERRDIQLQKAFQDMLQS